MKEKELDELKRKLDILIENGASKDEIYEMSVKVDKMIVEYYKKNELGEITK